MATIKDFPVGATTLTATGAYHKLATFKVTIWPTPGIIIEVVTFASQAARNATPQATPLAVTPINVSLGVVTTFLATAMWKALLPRIYTVIKADPMWSGGADVADPDE